VRVLSGAFGVSGESKKLSLVGLDLSYVEGGDVGAVDDQAEFSLLILKRHNTDNNHHANSRVPAVRVRLFEHRVVLRKVDRVSAEVGGLEVKVVLNRVSSIHD
jgi:hypothetical protein